MNDECWSVGWFGIVENLFSGDDGGEPWLGEGIFEDLLPIENPLGSH